MPVIFNNILKTLRQKAFSLIEILITVIIAGVILSLAFFNYQFVIERFRAKEGEQLLYAMVGDIARDMVDNPSTVGLPRIYVSQTSKPPTFFYNNMAMVESITGSDRCYGVAVFRKGNTNIGVPNTCGIGNMGISHNAMYSLSIYYKQPNGKTALICSDSGDGICQKLGYSYNTQTTQAWGGGTTIDIN